MPPPRPAATAGDVAGAGLTGWARPIDHLAQLAPPPAAGTTGESRMVSRRGIAVRVEDLALRRTPETPVRGSARK
ncbi:hypothetical protein SMICM304S_11075 [Streptomyces microflavus]